MPLGRIDAIASAPTEESISKLDVFGSALDAVMSRGIVLPSIRGGYGGDMPPDITLLDDNQLGNLLNQLSEYAGYVESELAKAEIANNIAREQLEQLRALLRIGLKHYEGKLTVQDKSDTVESDARIIELKKNYIYTDSVHKLTKTVLNRVQRNWDTVSRRITQRGQEVDRITRGNVTSNIQNPRFKLR